MTDNVNEPPTPPYEPASTSETINERDGQSNRRPISTSDVVLSCVALVALAIALPLLDLLGRNAEFFLAQRSSKMDIVLLGIVLALVIPLLVGIAIAGIFHLHRGTGLTVLAIAIALFSGLFALRLLGATPASALPAWAELVIAAAVGGIVAYAFFRFGNVRTFIRLTAIAPLVVLGLFFFGSSTSELVFASDQVTDTANVAVEDPAQVVLVIFDEFPIASIMDGDGNIQEHVYPGFSQLAADSTWYRNAITIQQQSEHSIPAIVSGKDGSHEKLPTAGDYPFTLFTLLADSYDLHVFEAVTDLCPEYACENETRPARPMSQRWRALADDLWIVSGHLLLPNDLADDLPPIDSTWSNFSAGGGNSNQAIIARFQELTYDADRRDPIEAFVGLAGEPYDEPRLLFINALVPHVPWTYLPSGQLYDAPGSAPGTKSPGWGDDEWLVDQAYQMHLAQVGYADTILGNLIANLKSAGTYDDTLLIVMADHGVAVRPNVRHRRSAISDTIGDIAAIPLFIKTPSGDGGVIDDYRAETIDILPTISDVLGIELPWAVEGVSLLSNDRPQRTDSQIEGTEGVITFGVDGSEAMLLAARKVEHFGPDGPFGLAPPGYASLLGLSLDAFEVQQATNAAATIRNKDAYAAVDLDGPVVPAWVSGTLRDVPGESVVAVIVNGRVVALTESRTGDDGIVTYGAIAPPDAFVDGRNLVEIALVRQTADGWALTVLPS